MCCAVTKMNLIYLLAFAVVGQARALVELNCSDNATCIDSMSKELVRSLRQRRAVRLFDTITIEPVESTARGGDALTRLLAGHAVSFDWDDFTFRLSSADNKDDALDLEVYESRTANDASDEAPKKSNNKVVEEVAQDKTPKRIKRRPKRKVMQAVIPLLFGMKSAAIAIFSLAVVAVITIKAFLASKLALMVTVGMAAKKLYENYTGSTGLQNHPFLYSQYPIDFPGASSQTYSVSQQYGSSDMYSPTGLASQAHTHEILQTNDPSAQSSQQASSLLTNSTHAAERWDGKSSLLKFLEPVVSQIRSFVDPIASVFYGAMPATFRGLAADAFSADGGDREVEADAKRPRQVLLPQPRLIAQRKATLLKATPRYRPKKYTELRLDLHRLKYNKDLLDYIKNKKYKYNYPRTYYYPRVKYYVNPAMFVMRPNNSRLLPYRRTELKANVTVEVGNVTLVAEPSDWKPIVVLKPEYGQGEANKTESKTKKVLKKKRKRPKRSVEFRDRHSRPSRAQGEPRSKAKPSPLLYTLAFAKDYVNNLVRSALKSKGEPPFFYTVTYNILMYCLEAFDSFVRAHEDIIAHFTQHLKTTKTKRKKKLKTQNLSRSHEYQGIAARAETHRSD